MSGRRRRESGAAAVEFALVAPLVLALLGGLLGLGLYAVYAGAAEYAARQAVREALLPTGRGSYADAAAVGRAARDAVPGLLGAPTSVEVCPGADCVALTGDGCPLAAPAPRSGRVGDVPVRLVAATTTAAAACPPDREGRLVVVRVTWDLPAVRAALGLVPFLGDDLATVRMTATGRRE